MAIELKVPTLGESISSGILAAWHVKDGDYVEKDQVVYELETDKITSEGLAEVAGAISLKVAEGDEVEIGQAVASIDDSAEKPAGSEEKGTEKGEDAAEATDKPAPDDRKKEAQSEEKDYETGDSESKGQDAKSNEGHLSPAARRAATEEGIDPSSVEGSGKGGRVSKGDLLATAKSRSKPEETSSSSDSPAKEAPAKTSSGDRSSRRRMSPMRRKIAQRLVAAQQQAAMLTTFNEADLTAVKALRAQYQDAFVKKHGIKLGFMSFFVKAVVDAIQTVPAISSMIDGEEIVENSYYDIGIAVSTDKGLMVPVLRDCESLSLAGIEKSISEYAKKARDGKIKLEDLQGGVFTITNGGIFGSLISTPILNAPQSAILGMHAIQDRPIAVNGEVVIRPMMYLALSYDHRIVDGKEAVTFLVRLKQTLEDPTRLLLEV